MLLRPAMLTRCKRPASAPCDRLPKAVPAAFPCWRLHASACLRGEQRAGVGGHH